ncbi:MAG: ADP-ribosylglycohydrolase family protein [Bacillota bacterium]|nr:ADP-ribosylglycohydrolase family protein [Bacillota bacterium]
MTDYIKGSIWGLIVGDALGVPVEFEDREALKQNPVTGMRGYGTYNLPEGTWSDDSSMTLCTIAALCKGKIDCEDIMSRFAAWRYKGRYTPYGRCFDCGGTTKRAIEKYRRGILAEECGGMDERDNGNGALMRILPVVLYQFEKYQHFKCCDRHAIIKPICRVAALTHVHPINQIGCALYAQLLGELINYKHYNEPTKPCDNLFDVVALAMKGDFRWRADWNFGRRSYGTSKHQRPYSRLKDIRAFAALPEEEIKSGGYVVNTLEAAIWCFLNTESYADCVLKAVNLGNDTDTTAAVAGAIAGAYYGSSAIPAEWLNCLARKEWLAGMIDKFEKICVGMRCGDAE